jgi:hypothetical protein
VNQFTCLLFVTFVASSTFAQTQGTLTSARAGSCAIRVVDDQTKRGVPLVELETIHHLLFVTDHDGWIHVAEHDLIGRDVFFFVRSHGYRFAKDGFGMEGTTLHLEPDTEINLSIHREQPAERLYRSTGRNGANGESVIADVIGCDSVLMTRYRDRLYWFWGDTARPHHPIGGSFHMTGATTPLPGPGTWDPELGIPWKHFADNRAIAKPVAVMPNEGPTWLTALTTIPDLNSHNESSRETLVAAYVKIRPPLEAYRWGFCIWDDVSEQFTDLGSTDIKPLLAVEPQTHTILRDDADGHSYVYFCSPFPWRRVRADLTSFVSPDAYESWTCLQDGTTVQEQLIERDANDQALYRWRAKTLALTPADQQEFLRAGLLKPEEAMCDLHDPQTGRHVLPHSGSMAWNPYRKAWIAVFVEIGGDSSFLGEVWIAESSSPVGPWNHPKKIITHNKYSFYNPKHHSILDASDGKVIYIDGTYSHTFSGNDRPTPRYDYNQILYRLDLEALFSPSP